MQSVVQLRVSVVDVDAVLSKDSKNVTMPAPRRDPERIQAILINLVDIDPLVLEHEADEVFTTTTVKLSVTEIILTCPSWQQLSKGTLVVQ